MGISNNIETDKEKTTSGSTWSNREKIGFRFVFLFILLLVFPLRWEWYEELFSSSSIHEFLNTLTGGSRFNLLIQIPTESGRWGLASYASWGLTALVALLLATVWTIVVGKNAGRSYPALYYWLHVLVRYRLAIGLIAFGFIKFFPMQMPFPSIANLNTGLGDYASFKLYWQIVGLSFRYEIFLGFLEIAIGILFFFRSTTVIGAIATIGVLFNIAHANLAYDGAVHNYASYFVLLSVFVLALYIPNIWRLFIKGETVRPIYYRPQVNAKWVKAAYIGGKSLFIFVFVVVYGYGAYDLIYNQGKRKEPVVAGLPHAAGYYEVKRFVLNGDTLPYSARDSVRWHEAIFERYSTFAYKVNKELYIDITNGGAQTGDLLKNYEFTGRAGGYAYLYYEIDTAENLLYLVDKHQLFYPRGYNKRFNHQNEVNLKELYGTPVGDDIQILRWSYERPTKDRIHLSGIDLNQDSISVLLERIKPDYPIGKGWYSKSNVYSYKVD